jgi:hypothetical protein
MTGACKGQLAGSIPEADAGADGGFASQAAIDAAIATAIVKYFLFFGT